MAARLHETPGLPQALRAARAWGARPTEFLETWSARDRYLALALEHLDATTGEHGVPAHIATDPLRMFTTEIGLDFAAKKLAEVRRQYQESGASSDGITFRIKDDGYPPDDDSAAPAAPSEPVGADA